MKIASFLSKPFWSSLREKKNAVYYFQIFLFVPEMFKFLKYANKPSNKHHTLNESLLKYDEKSDDLSQFVSAKVWFFAEC